MSEEGRLACPEHLSLGIDSTKQDRAPNPWATLCSVDSGKTCMANRDDTEKLLKYLLDWEASVTEQKIQELYSKVGLYPLLAKRWMRLHTSRSTVTMVDQPWISSPTKAQVSIRQGPDLYRTPDDFDRYRTGRSFQ